MNIRKCTKVIFLICLVSVTVIPIFSWLIWDRDLSSVAAFVAATSGPLGVLTGAMAASKINRNKNQGDS